MEGSKVFPNCLCEFLGELEWGGVLLRVMVILFVSLEFDGVKECRWDIEFVLGQGD